MFFFSEIRFVPKKTDTKTFQLYADFPLILLVIIVTSFLQMVLMHWFDGQFGFLKKKIENLNMLCTEDKEKKDEIIKR